MYHIYLNAQSGFIPSLDCEFAVSEDSPDVMNQALILEGCSMFPCDYDAYRQNRSISSNSIYFITDIQCVIVNQCQCSHSATPCHLVLHQPG